MSVEKLTARKCPACGSELSRGRSSAGLCPACLVELALESPSLLAEIEDETLAQPLGAYAAGQVLGRRYRVRALLGRGGMGEVFRATDLKLRVDVALKALRRELLADTRALETLRQEVRVARAVVSPNVCRVFDLVELDGRELVSMEYVDGITLLEILRKRSPLDLSEAREIAAQLLAGLEAIHSAGLVHRDVKPENLMITRSGRVVLMDFGIAKGLAEGLTRTISGTPAYMAPEQGRGEALDARADVFSAGVVLAEMIAPGGVRTHGARQRIWRGIHHAPPELADSPWAAVLTKAVAAQREERYPSAAALARALEEVTLRVAGAEDVRPYPGLASFTEDDADYFFGRELEVEEMWKKLHRPHLLGLIGPSGAGKSSFLRAGLLPAMPAGWRALVATPGSRPLLALAQSLARELAGDTEAVEDLPRFEEPEVAVSLFARWRRRHNQALLVVDQFEELFTLSPAETQQRFAELLGRLALDADVHVLLSLRDDFLTDCSHHESLAPIFSELTPLRPLTGGALRRALVQPALKCGYRFEDDSLVDEMVAEVGGERGALPLLAFAASRLWEHRDREQGLLTREAYEHIGGVAGALAQHAEATLERIGRDRIPVVRELFRNLVTAQGTRAARDREELLSVFDGNADVGEGFTPSRAGINPAPTTAGGTGDVGEGLTPSRAGVSPASTPAQVLDALIDARLLTSYKVPAGDEEGAEPHHRVEIIHESLLSHWPRLVRWQTQDSDSAQLRDQIRQAAQMWDERGRPQDLLWTGTSFDEYRLWRERYEGGLSTAEEEFGRAMVRRAERRKRRRRIAVSGAFALLLAVLGVIAFFGWRTELERRRAEAETLRAEAGKLIALGQLALEDYPTESLAWATKSLELSDTREGRMLVLRALSEAPPVTVAPATKGEGRTHKAFSPDGRWLATADGENQAIWLWHEDGGEPRLLYRFPEPGGQPRGRLNHAFASNEALIAVQGDAFRVLSVPDGRELRPGEEGRGQLHWPSQNGYYSLSVDQGRYWIRWWPYGEGAARLVGSMEGLFGEWDWAPGDLRDVSPPLPKLRVDTTGSWLAYARGTAVYLRSLEDWSRGPRRIGKHDRGVGDVAFHPAGDRVAAIDGSGAIRVWSTAESPSLEPQPLYNIQANEWDLIQYDASGRWLTIVGAHQGVNKVWLWDLTAPEGTEPRILPWTDEAPYYSLFFHPTRPWVVASGPVGAVFLPLLDRCPTVLRVDRERLEDLAFSPDGAWLVTSTGFGVRAWPLRGQNHGASRVVLPLVDTNNPTITFDPAGENLAFSHLHGKELKLVPLDGGPSRTLPGGAPHGLKAFSPDGRLLATVPYEASPEETEGMSIRVWDLETDRVRTLGPLSAGRSAYLAFDDERRLRWVGSGGEGLPGGERVFDLENGSVTVVAESGDEVWRVVSPDGEVTITVEESPGGAGRELFWRGPAGSEPRRITAHGDGFEIEPRAIDTFGRWMVTGDHQGVVRVGPIAGGEPHLLLGHQGWIRCVAISPDGRWIASGAADGTVRLWPVPDLSQPPLHTLPHEELIAKLHSLTNVRVVEDADSSSGWKLDYAPFPGWKRLPEW